MWMRATIIRDLSGFLNVRKRLDAAELQLDDVANRFNNKIDQ
jgi:hypothetical protein